MLFSWEGLLNSDKRQQIIAKTIIYVCLHCSKSRAFTTALKLFATCKDPWSVIKIPKTHTLLDIIVCEGCLSFSHNLRHFTNYDLKLQTAEFLLLTLCDFGETLFNARHWCALYVAERCSRKNASNSRILNHNHVTFTPIAKIFCCFVDWSMLSMLYVRLTIKVKVGIPESFKVG